jgi:tetratricopeptide (TPR) repeat protein/tRNA A-37 threonylcarbamoyl transferase component Bud32
LERFEEAWQADPPPSLDAFLPPDPARRRAMLPEVAAVDLEYRLKAGEPARAEDYLRRYPELGEGPAPLALLAQEYRQRRHREPGLLPEDYLRRFPQYGPELAALLDTAANRDTGKYPGGKQPNARADHGTPALLSEGRATPAVPGDAPPAGRYRPVRFHARGGLGEVFLAEDAELRRPVALKRIQGRYADDPDSRRRFLVEAEITARLEHPGVVPVLGLVEDGAGQPCYAMRFIEGPTLAQAIKEFHEADLQAGRDPGERSLALRKLLGHFVAVCNTVGYAHSRGVLHRDLKPQNVMLGKYGETLVVDWGLAKPLDRTEAERAGGEQSLGLGGRAGPEGATQPGEVKGTPEFMSPEQAAGKMTAVGPPADIFGLGAVLYTILTGRPPYQGNLHDVLVRAHGAVFPAPRRLKPGVPRALEAVCRKAMAVQPGDRYATAQELGAEVERWLADQPVTAWREPLLVRSGRWVRRHKPLVAAASSMVLVALVLGGLGLAWWQRQREAVERAVGEDLREAVRLQGEERWAPALQALERAEGRLTDLAPDSLGERIRKIKEEVAFVEELEETRLQAATIGSGGRGDEFRDFAAADRAYAVVFAKHGFDLAALSRQEVARRIRGSGIRNRLVAALDNWGYLKHFLPARTGPSPHLFAALADDDPWRRRLRDPGLGTNGARVERLAQDKDTLRQPPVYLYLLSEGLQYHGRPAAAERLLRRAQEQHPEDFWLNFQLANLLLRKGPAQLEEAVGYYHAALARKPDSAATYNNLGYALCDQGKLARAERAFRKAVALQPRTATPYIGLGYALSAQKKFAGARAAYHKAIALEPGTAAGYTGLGAVFHHQGKHAAAERAHRKAVALQPDGVTYSHLGGTLADRGKYAEAVRICRKAIALQPDYHDAHSNLGYALSGQGRFVEAEQAYRKALALEPSNAKSCFALGNVLQKRGKFADAVRMYRKAIVLRPHYPNAYNNLGSALFGQRKYAEAEHAFRKTIALKPGYAVAHFNLGNALREQGKLAEAVEEYRRAVALDPQNTDARYSLGIALSGRGKQAEAAEVFRKAVALKPDDAVGNYGLGVTLSRQGKYAEAVRAYRKAIGRKPNFAEAHCNLGDALLQSGKLTEGLRALRRGHRLGKDRPGWPYPSAQWVRDAESLVRLEGKLAQVLAGTAQPADSAERVALAALCQKPFKRRYAAAALLYREAFRVEPKLGEDPRSEHRYNAACAAALAGCGKGKDAASLDAKERSRLRSQAVAWLRADLTAWRNLLEKAPKQVPSSVGQTLRHWQKDTDLAGVRDRAALAKLPEAERKDWAKLWGDVAALLAKAGAKM